MIILSLGVPRSGTTLVFNVLREILTRRGIGFRTVNTNYPETEAFFKNWDFRGNVLMHAHNVPSQMQNLMKHRDTAAYFNYRDPRDVVISLMRLHDCSFEHSLKLVENAFAQLHTARKFRRIMFIPYDHLMGATDSLIFQIALRMGVFLSLNEVIEIREATSLEAHSKIMHDVASGSVPVRQRNNSQRVLKESATHLINDRHIQSARSGRWRDELTPEQKQIATGRFNVVLEKLGFPA